MSLSEDARQVRSRLTRWLLAVTGIGCIGIGAVGVFLPGLPTTIFLIIASWCFLRSCPWLEQRLIRENRLFRPFLRYIEPGTPIPLRARLATLGVMWLAVSISCFTITRWDQPSVPLIIVILVAACIGSWFIMRMGRRARSAA